MAFRNRRAKLAKSNKPVLNDEVHVPTDRIAAGERPFLSKVSALTKDNEGDSVYERALRTHAEHNRIHGYSSHVLRESVLESWWSKPAFLLDVMLQELKKPVQERLGWLFWHDADTVVLNPNIPLETFLPPPGWDDLHLLVTSDINGLNNGLFLMRVSQVNLELLLAWLAYEHYNPDKPLEFGDQSAMHRCLQHPKFNETAVVVPQRWFNSYNVDLDKELEENLKPDSVRAGEFMIHFAGVPERPTQIAKWLARIRQHRPDYELALKYTSYVSEVPAFWEKKEKERKSSAKRLENTHRQADETMEELKREMETYTDSLMSEAKEEISKKIEDLEGVMKESLTKDHEPSIRTAIRKLVAVRHPGVFLLSLLPALVRIFHHPISAN